MDKLTEIRQVLQDRVFDVIGRIIGEDDIAKIYEELIEVPKSEWKPRIIKELDYIIQEKYKVLKNIESLLSGNKLDRSKLGEIRDRANDVITADEVRRFVEAFVTKFKGSSNLLDKQNQIYRIFLPPTLKADLERVGIGMMIEGTYYKSNYDYIALGNKSVICMLKNVANPSCSILSHPYLQGVLYVFRLEAIDGKGRGRNGKIIGFYYDGINTETFDLRRLWEFSSVDKLNSITIDRDSVLEGYARIKSIIENMQRDFMEEVQQITSKLAQKISQTITSYFYYRSEKLDKQVTELEKRQKESPRFSHDYQAKKQEQKKLGLEFKEALERLRNEMRIKVSIELIGVSKVIPDKYNLRDKVREDFQRKQSTVIRSEFTKLNQQINSENSETTNQRFKNHPEQWFQYHELLEQNSVDWGIRPVDVIIERIKQFPSWWKVGDFGCGKATIMNKLGNRILSFDHYAIDERVISCDIKSVPLGDKSLDIIVFSLSLMSRNWPDYIKKARQCLVTNGTLLIADTTHSIEEGRLSNLTDILRVNNFEIYSRYEKPPFTFIEATKREFLKMIK